MTSQPLDRATITDRAVPRKEYAVERARVPLVLKLFGLTALLIMIVVGVAVGITIERANRVANETVNASISMLCNSVCRRSLTSCWPWMKHWPSLLASTPTRPRWSSSVTLPA